MNRSHRPSLAHRAPRRTRRRRAGRHRTRRRRGAALPAGILAVLLALPLAVGPLGAQETPQEGRTAPDTIPARTASLVGQVVSAADGRPVEGAVVNLLGARQGAVTDTAGNFRIPRTFAGTDTVEVRFIGYEPSRVELDLAPDATTRAVLLLSPTVVRVADIEVEVRREEGLGKLRGFHQRRARGFGVFITPEQVQRRDPRMPSDLLRGVPGVSVGAAHLGKAPVRMSRGVGNCPPNVFVDGIYMAGMEVDDIPAQDVWAVELYRGASDLPVEFNRGRSGCGAVVIWTPTGERID